MTDDLAANVAEAFFEKDMKVPACERKAMLADLVRTAIAAALQERDEPTEKIPWEEWIELQIHQWGKDSAWVQKLIADHEAEEDADG